MGFLFDPEKSQQETLPSMKRLVTYFPPLDAPRWPKVWVAISVDLTFEAESHDLQKEWLWGIAGMLRVPEGSCNTVKSF